MHLAQPISCVIQVVGRHRRLGKNVFKLKTPHCYATSIHPWLEWNWLHLNGRPVWEELLFKQHHMIPSLPRPLPLCLYSEVHKGVPSKEYQLQLRKPHLGDFHFPCFVTRQPQPASVDFSGRAPKRQQGRQLDKGVENENAFWCRIDTTIIKMTCISNVEHAIM